jgi:glycerate dehydrogenase
MGSATMKAVFLDFGTVSRGDLDVAPLECLFDELVLFDDTAAPQIAARVTDAEVVLANRARLEADTLEAAPSLRLIALAATGTNNVDLESARRRGIAVTNIRAYCTQSVVQHVFGVLLALTHHFARYHRLLMGGAWGRAAEFGMLDYPIRELAELKLGIVGFGELGRGVARIADAFGMEVLVANRPGGEPQPGRLDLPALLPQVDVLTLHCPLTPATLGMIGEREIRLMRHDAVLVNTARGALVDSAALARALKAGRLGGAGIDVLAQEPPVDGSPLLDPTIPNLILTPHIAWAAREARQRALDQMAENAAAFLRGEKLRRVD